MDVILPMPGTYVIAVSGGVDSMALLDILYKNNQEKKDWRLVVAHLDHGIRADSSEDRRFVEDTAKKYGLPFIYKRESLGAGTSEALARRARYKFLEEVKAASDARAIVTAHHQDDLLETAIINLIRGTGRKGLTALSSRSDILRPLLSMPKVQLANYAKEQELSWREDSTNADETYLRNYVRHRLLTRFDKPSKDKLLKVIDELRLTNQQIDVLLTKELGSHQADNQLERLWFNSLPHIVSREVLADWFRQNQIKSFDRKTLERLVVAAKVALVGQVFPISGNYYLLVYNNHLALELRER